MLVFCVVSIANNKAILALAEFNAPDKYTVLALAVTNPPAVALAKLKAAAVLELTILILVFWLVLTPCR